MFRLNFPFVLGVSSVVASVALALGVTSPAVAQEPMAAGSGSALAFTVKDIKGADVDLSQKYAGKVVLILNVASRCGNTKQYGALEALYQKHSKEGLAILGFPCNDFGGQEPGSEADIVQFCTSKYDVTFDLFGKVKVKGPDSAPLFKSLMAEPTSPVGPGPISWNFEKFLVSREGKVVARFKPGLSPDAPEVVKAIEAELAK